MSECLDIAFFYYLLFTEPRGGISPERTGSDGLRKFMTSFYIESQRYVTVERKRIFYFSINKLKHFFVDF